MKREKPKTSANGEMLPEYDFSTMKGGQRGRYYQAYRAGHTVAIDQPDGTKTVHYFTLQDGAVMLDPEVRVYFPDTESVNNALRTLIDLIPSKHKPSTSHS
jgi:hypothetical protein